ncbi:MAG TPA: hypothetical protein VFO36_06840 [Nitrospiraceae bacterium]|nr:hypothetical protein [Nitrospiraceae bacterium]
MRPVIFLALLGALTIYAFHTLFVAPGWGVFAAFILFVLGMHASDRSGVKEQRDGRLPVEQIVETKGLVVMRRTPAALAVAAVLVLGMGLGWLLRDTAAAEIMRARSSKFKIGDFWQPCR